MECIRFIYILDGCLHSIRNHLLFTFKIEQTTLKFSPLVLYLKRQLIIVELHVHVCTHSLQLCPSLKNISPLQ